jgi:pimeloyl-ACP methyl ester carboxylesterase
MLTLDRRFDHHGQQVAWTALGDGDPLVLVHGFPWSAQAWRRIAPWLARRYRVYAFDMLGCGQSAAFEGQDLRPEVQDELLAALIRHWGLARPHLVGHDFGGLAALRGHMVQGLDYASLTLIDSVGMLPSGSPFFAHAQHHNAAFAEAPGFVHAAAFDAFVQFGAHQGLPRETVDLYLQPWSGAAGQAAFYRHIAQSNQAPIEEVYHRLAPLPFPTHVVWGAHDANVTPEQGREMARRLDADSFTLIPDAAHVVMEDAPEAVLAALLGARDARS